MYDACVQVQDGHSEPHAAHLRDLLLRAECRSGAKYIHRPDQYLKLSAGNTPQRDCRSRYARVSDNFQNLIHELHVLPVRLFCLQ